MSKVPEKGQDGYLNRKYKRERGREISGGVEGERRHKVNVHVPVRLMSLLVLEGWQ